jgi:phage terminase Nu1 subunit (DNA packaging protein)
MKPEEFTEKPTEKRMQETFITTLDGRKTVSSRQVADILGVSIRAVQKYARQGIIPGAFQPRGKRGGWRFRRNMLEAWWAEKSAEINESDLL